MTTEEQAQERHVSVDRVIVRLRTRIDELSYNLSVAEAVVDDLMEQLEAARTTIDDLGGKLDD